MKVLFDGDGPQESPAVGLLLTPGENDVDDDKAAVLIAAGVVRAVSPAMEDHFGEV